MTESKKTETPTADLQQQRKTWSRPVLSRYGQVKDLTASGSQGMKEMGGLLQPQKRT